ncbi:MAG: helix-turn-helix domain-containing protein [Candidimonas sp.]|jgi:DNA-binding IclR family transcriptional regulator
MLNRKNTTTNETIAVVDHEPQRKLSIARPQRLKSPGAGSSLSRLLNILELFSLERTTVSVQDVARLYGVARSTSYRLLGELCETGLLAQLGKGVYSLGPRIIELERLLQLTDPLLGAGKQVMKSMHGKARNRAILLCTRYKDRVLCIHHVGAETIAFGDEQLVIRRGRGLPLPLFEGAASLIILAHLPLHQLRSLYGANADTILAAGLGGDFPSFRRHLGKIRRKGHARTQSAVDARIVGLAVPILLGQEILGSLAAIIAGTPEEHAQEPALIALLESQAQRIAEIVSTV